MAATALSPYPPRPARAWVLAGLLLVLAGAGRPTRGDPSPLPDSPAERRAVASPQDRSFLNSFVEASLAATEAGQLAAQHATTAPVRQHAGQLQAAFNTARRQLAMLVAVLPLPPLPREPGARQAASLERLRQAPARAFDGAYLRQQLDEQEQLLGLLRIESGTGDNPDIKAFATAQLPRLRALREHTQALAATLPPSPAAGFPGD